MQAERSVEERIEVLERGLASAREQVDAIRALPEFQEPNEDLDPVFNKLQVLDLFLKQDAFAQRDDPSQVRVNISE